MRIPIRISRLAIWSQRLGAFALPVLVFAIALHRLDYLDALSFELVLAIATGLGGLALVCAVLAYVRIWNTGDRGWGRASFGFLAGGAALIPFAYALVLVLLYPSTADISTDRTDPPELALRPNDGLVMEFEGTARAQSFPTIASRAYQVPPDILFALSEGVAGLRDWTVLRRSGSLTNDGEGVLNLRQTTLLGWDNEIALRVRPESNGARIDLRASSVHEVRLDLGLNGRLSAAFLADLDEAVNIYQRRSRQGGN